MSGWWIADFYQAGQTVLLVSWIFWVILSICLHELAHGWAAIAQGDNTPRELGRMTMNPLVHMGPMSLLVFALVGIAWGLMPTDPSRYRSGRKGRVIVSGAGPAMNVAIAVVVLTIAGVWRAFVGVETPFTDNVDTFLWIGGMLNIVLAAFNMLPVPPLDGSGVLCGLSFRCYQFFQQPQAQMLGFFVVIVMFMSGAFGILFDLAELISIRYITLIELLLS